ncbi:MAG: hypothetical protein AAB330_01820, partial [Bacteroidota bacterium]
VHSFLLNKWYFDELYDATAVKGTVAIANFYRWFDNTVIDGIVNGTARWTLGLTKGTKEAWEEGNVGAIFYLIVAAAVSAYAGWVTASGLLPPESVLSTKVGYGVVGLGVTGLTFFLFYVGVGGFDNKIVDGLVNFTAYLAGFFGLLARRVQTGKVQTYLAFVILGVMIFFLWFR